MDNIDDINMDSPVLRKEGYFTWAQKGLWNLAGGVKNVIVEGAKSLTKNALMGIFKSKLVQQDTDRIIKNKEEIKKLTGGDEWNSAIEATAENLFKNLILPLANQGDVEELGFFGQVINDGKDDLINSLVSLIETVLRNLASQAPQSSSSSSNEKISFLAEENHIVPNSDLQSAPQEVITKPNQFGASIVAQVLRIVKKVVADDKYLDVREGKASEELKKQFFKEIADVILTSAFPDKANDKSLPFLLRQLLKGWGASKTGLSWDKLVDIIADQMGQALPSYTYINGDVRLNGDQEKFCGMILEPVFGVIKQLGEKSYNELPLTPLVGIDKKHCELYDATLKAILSGDVLDKDKGIIEETFGHLEMLITKLMARVLIDLGGTEDPADGLAKVVVEITKNIKQELATITPENKEEKLKLISKNILGNLLGKKGQVSNEEFQALVKKGELSEGFTPSELKAKARLMKILPPQVSVSKIYDSTILPQIMKIVGEVYETVSKGQEQDVANVNKIKEVPGLDGLVKMILNQVDSYLDKATSDKKTPLIPNNPLLDGLVKNIFTSQDKTASNFVRKYIEIAVQRLVANLAKGKGGQKAEELFKSRLESILMEVVKGGSQPEVFIKELLNELLTDEDLKALLPPTFQSIDIKALILPALIGVAKPYLTDITKNVKGLEEKENRDQEIIKKFKGLGTITNHYTKMIMGIITTQINGGVMSGGKDSMANFVNWIAKALVPAGASETETKEFVETHLKRILNRTLVYHFDKLPKMLTAQEQLGFFMEKMIEEISCLGKKLRDASKEEFNEVKFNVLFGKYKDVLTLELQAVVAEQNRLAEMNKEETFIPKNTLKRLEELQERKTTLELALEKKEAKNFTPQQKKELYKTLLKIEASDQFLEKLVPDELLKEILPGFAVGMARPQILFQLVNNLDTKMIAGITEGAKLSVIELLNKGAYQSTLEALRGSNEDVKTVRKAMSQVISRTLKKGIADGLNKAFGKTGGSIVNWLLYIIFFPVIVVGHWALMFAIDQLWLKQIDQYLKDNDDFDKILYKVGGHLPRLLNAIYADKKNENHIKIASRAIVDEFSSIFSTEWMRNLIAKYMVPFLTPAKEEDGFLDWLKPYLITEEKKVTPAAAK